LPITFSGTGTLGGTSTLTISDTAGVYFNGQLTDGGGSSPGGLVLAGTQTVFLTNTNSTNSGGSGSNLNNYLGGTLINGAIVVVNDSTALGSNTSSQTLGISSGTLLANAPVTFNQGLVLNGSFTLSAPATSITSLSALAAC